ncbi:MAG: hypothetical protein GF364_07340 [Candidatus Lokiarchaeota archaeon]|nr:hypothetical protein [Candidatus Lokiarchaeota archaeon]
MDLSNIKGNILLYLALWDDDIGPTVVEQFPEETDIDLYENADKIFLSFQTIFGNSPDVQFEKTNLILPLKSQNIVCKILLDTIPNEDLRGGYQPFIIVFIFPIIFPEESLHIFANIQESIISRYKAKKTIHLKQEIEKIVLRAKKEASKLFEQGEINFKDKNYAEAKKSFSGASNISKIINEENIAQRYEAKLNDALIKQAKQVYIEAIKDYKDGEYKNAEKIFRKSLDLAKKTDESNIIKKIRKSMDKNYKNWAKSYAKIGKKSKKKRNFIKANEYYKKALNVAQKSQIRKLIKKYNKKLDKVPHVPLENNK